jgi:formylglycine-generating enzyme required for sulfatase activity
MLSVSVFIALSTPARQAPAPFEDKLPGTVVSWKMIPVPDGNITVKGKEIEIKKLAAAEAETTWDMYDIYAYQLDLPVEERDKSADARSRPSKPYGAPDRGFGHAGFPALGIHSSAAQEFCKWLSKKTAKAYRLPTEAEWEYLARAGEKSNPTNLDDLAWHYDNTEQPQAVKKKKPNAWGIYDTFGNVMEWAIGLDGTPVCCGGSYQEKASQMTFDFRKLLDPDWQTDDAHSPKSHWWLSNGAQVGFRVVCDLK